MFSIDGVTLRPLDLADVELAYGWHVDLGIEIASGWGRRQALTTFRQRFEAWLAAPPDAHRVFGIALAERVIGRIDLSLIDTDHRNAMIGLFIAERALWGQGHGKTAIRLMLDFAFTVENLERVYAHVYGFNTRSIRLMRSAGLAPEGILRQHEVHNGQRQDLHVFGILKHEFYERHRTIFGIPREITGG